MTEFDPFARHVFYDNEFHASQSSDSIEVIDPATEEPVGEVADCEIANLLYRLTTVFPQPLSGCLADPVEYSEPELVSVDGFSCDTSMGRTCVPCELRPISGCCSESSNWDCDGRLVSWKLPLVIVFCWLAAGKNRHWFREGGADRGPEVVDVRERSHGPIAHRHVRSQPGQLGRDLVFRQREVHRTQDVIAVAELSDGSTIMTQKKVKVTIGGCGG